MNPCLGFLQDMSSLLPYLSVQLWVWVQVSIVVDPFVRTVGQLCQKTLLSLFTLRLAIKFSVRRLVAHMAT